MKSLILSLGLLFGAVSAAGAEPMYDPGGSIFERMEMIELLEDAITYGEVRIEGVCLSACTMYLSIPEVCVAENTVLGFHSAAEIQEDGSAKKSNFGNMLLMTYYPKKIQDWVRQKKALESLEMTYMDAKTAWSLGIDKCKGEETKYVGKL